MLNFLEGFDDLPDEIKRGGETERGADEDEQGGGSVFPIQPHSSPNTNYSGEGGRESDLHGHRDHGLGGHFWVFLQLKYLTGNS